MECPKSTLRLDPGSSDSSVLIFQCVTVQKPQRAKPQLSRYVSASSMPVLDSSHRDNPLHSTTLQSGALIKVMANQNQQPDATICLFCPRLQPPANWRDWAGLPRDVLTLIFKKLGWIGILWPAQAVCRPWRRLSFDPDNWRSIDMRDRSDLLTTVDIKTLTRTAINHSAGHVEEFYADDSITDDLLEYIAERIIGLRCLVLISSWQISDDGLTGFISRCPLLDELQITNCSFSEETYGTIGQARPGLKRFCLNKVWLSIPDMEPEIVPYFEIEYDKEAVQIANYMPQLRELQLVGNHITNKGLNAILDNCLQLESLDIRVCLNVDVDAELQAKLARIETVKLPRDSTADYWFQTGLEEPFDLDYSSDHSDSDLAYCNLLSSDSDISDDDLAGQDYQNNYDDDSFPDFLM